MPIVPLSRIACARSGDKGEGSNVGVLARSETAYLWLERELTAERVRAHMASVNKGGVKRYASGELQLLNFILEDSLGGGGSASLKTDAQGKTHGLAVLRMQVDVPQAVLDATPAGDGGSSA